MKLRLRQKTFVYLKQNPKIVAILGNKLFVFFIACVFQIPSFLQAQVSGKVFHDINANGTQQSSNPTEPSLSGVTVTAFLPNGSSVTTTSAANGNYSFTAGQIPSGTTVRIEFSGLPTYANQAMVGSTLVRFLTAGTGATNINLGVAFPNDYCQANPSVVTPCYVESSDPNLDIVIKFSYNNVGTAPGDKTSITQSSMAGSLWGIAYSKSKKLIYAASVLKTHVPLGPRGLDAIYTVDPFSGIANATPWVELTDDLGIAVSSVVSNPQYADNATRGVNLSPQNDPTAFVDVGKVGLGDIELSADEQTLYVVNLYDKKLYAISTITKQIVGSYAIPNPGCTNGQARPWAIGEYEGEIYVGVTCDGSSSGNPAILTDNSGVGNLSASVYRLSGGAFTQVLSFPLSYKREVPFQYIGGCDIVNQWKPWTSVVPATCADGNIGYPTPLFSDIEFDDNGNMTLGFIDRTGFQFGFENYGISDTTMYSMYPAGDILKACKTGSNWGIESVASGCSSAGGLAINTLDPDGYPMSWGEILDKEGEFYEGDYFHSDGNIDGTGLSYFPGHPEITIGGLLVLPNSGEVMSTSYDPVTGSPNYNTGGVIVLSNTTGKRTRNGFQIYETFSGGVTQGKGVGLGDLEALCEASVEIVNRVWNDTDKDGIQDPSEAAIANVCFEIFADFNNDGIPDGAALGTASTNALGFLSFTKTNIVDGDPTVPGNQAGPQVGKNYIISVCISDWTGGTGTGDLAGLILTSKDSDGTANGDVRDSDATMVSSKPQISVTAALTGQSQFTLGSGFRIAPPLCTSPAPSLSNVTICPGKTTILNPGTFASYAWSSSETTQTVAKPAGTYTVSVTGSDGCTATASATISEYAAPVPTLSNATVCPGKTFVLDPGSYSSYEWSSGETTQSVTKTAGTYTVTVTNSDGCTATTSATVDEYSAPVPILSNVTVCLGKTTTLNPGTFSSYAWSSSETTQTVLKPAGTYTVTVTDNNGCTAMPSATIDEYAAPVPTLSNATVCPGKTFVLDPGSYSSYEWSSGETTQSVTKTAGTYTVTVTDANGCTASTTGTVSEGAFIVNPAAITCSNTNTPADTNDDTFTVSITATNTAGGASNLYLIKYGATTLNPGGTAYGTDFTIGTDGEFAADGSSIYAITIEDFDDAACAKSINIGPVGNCSSCPPAVCLPLQVMRN